MLHVYVPVLMRSAKDFTVKFAGAGAGAGDEVFLNPVRFKGLRCFCSFAISPALPRFQQHFCERHHDLSLLV